MNAKFCKKSEKKILKWRNYLPCFFLFYEIPNVFASFRKIHIREKMRNFGNNTCEIWKKIFANFLFLGNPSHGSWWSTFKGRSPLNKGYRYRKLFNACSTKRTSQKLCFSTIKVLLCMPTYINRAHVHIVFIPNLNWLSTCAHLYLFQTYIDWAHVHICVYSTLLCVRA